MRVISSLEDVIVPYRKVPLANIVLFRLPRFLKRSVMKKFSHPHKKYFVSLFNQRGNSRTNKSNIDNLKSIKQILNFKINYLNITPN